MICLSGLYQGNGDLIKSSEVIFPSMFQSARRAGFIFQKLGNTNWQSHLVLQNFEYFPPFFSNISATQSGSNHSVWPIPIRNVVKIQGSNCSQEIIEGHFLLLP